MFRHSLLGHHQVISLNRGNYTICYIKPLILNEISFSSIKSYYNIFSLSNVNIKQFLKNVTNITEVFHSPTDALFINLGKPQNLH
jgi:hypothetical protein